MLLPPYTPHRPTSDWLLEKERYEAKVCQGAPDEIVLTNGLVSRRFQIGANFSTIGLDNLMTGASMLRTPEPDVSLTIDGKKFAVGGLAGQPDRAFLLPEWLPTLKPYPNALKYESYEEESGDAKPIWKKVRHASPQANYPPHEVGLVFHFSLPEQPGITVDVHYRLYSGLPLFAKWTTVHNRSAKTVRMDKFVSERLGVTEQESIVDNSDDWLKPGITVATDYSYVASHNVYWEADPEYTTQVNYDLTTPCVLEVRPPLGPSSDVAPGKDFETFRTYELVHDGSDRERRGLAVRKMFRTLAPWCTENPIMLHLTSTEPATVKTAIDQAADVGFEMVIFSFGSGLDMEDVSEKNLATYRKWHDYAKSKGLEMGGYSLLASRHIDDANDVINPKTGKPGGAIFGFSPCLGSEWARTYFEHMRTFLTETKFDLLEHDGSYPGDVCASTEHPGHRGLEDSQWSQFRTIADFYSWCRDRGIYLNVPDNYFLSGSNKTGMGYRETNWSLPRSLQHIHARQNLFDGTWQKTPSMGWMMVPLVEYQGGGAAATIEPLKDHLPDYALHLANNFGYGAQACYRGSRLYDSPETRDTVKPWVDWFKRHRDILESDVVHVKRADGNGLDGILHVNPALDVKAMAVIYNPTDHPVKEQFPVPLYYSGLDSECGISHDDGSFKRIKIGKGGQVVLDVSLAPKSCTWYQFR